MHLLLAFRPARWKILAFAFLAFATARAADPDRTLKGGWAPWDPYQFETINHGEKELTGFDIQLLRAIFKSADLSVAFEKTDWEVSLEAIKTGTQDITTGAYRTPEREEYAHFSDPYRTETDVLILPRGKSSSYDFNSTPEMLREFSRLKFRLGVARGFSYGPEVDAWLNDPANAALIHPAIDDNANLARLLRGEIDGFLADRLVAATIAWRNKVQLQEEEYPLVVYSSGIHILFSKKTCTPETVAAFNEGLRQVQASGEYNRIAQYYGIPVLLGITVYRPWFTLLDMVGVVAFAISGVLIARRERYDIFGAFVLAALPAAGGGVLRDLLTGRSPIGILRSPNYLYAIIATVLAGLLFYKITDALRARRQAAATDDTPVSRLHLPENIYLLFDAVGLAAFTVIGVVVAVEQQCQPLWLWGPLLAALTGAGGGILRDMLRADSNNPSLKGGFYPEVALIWGLFLALFLRWEAARLDLHEVFLGVIITILGALATRLLALRYNVESPFLYDHRAGSFESLLKAIDNRQIAWLRQLQKLPTDPSAFHPSHVEAASISDQLTALSTERLPDTLNRRFITLLQRQPRLMELQGDLFAFLQSAPHPPALTESLDAWLKTFVEILETPSDRHTRAQLIQSLNERKHPPCAPFERLAANLAGLVALE